ncbi:MAG: carotenoid 1,2-hydratase [Caldilineales bacterium]|nr:carotenoid 1,2-hydratase [Caldilineales bacterium]
MSVLSASRRRSRRWLIIGLSLALLVASVFLYQSRQTQPALGAEIIASNTRPAAGFRQAMPGIPLNFPADHGAHPDYQTEWWYFTGNLQDETGGRWGYQFTIFRRALTTESSIRDSEWAGNQVYLAHFALTDAAGQKHQAWERFSRAGADMAGAEAKPLRVWLEDWQVHEVAPDEFELTAQADDIALNLSLVAQKGPVLHGDEGYSRKGAKPGNASFYYSFPRLKSSGVLKTSGGEASVEGWSWMDHEWSTSALGEGQAGWDWFSIQLDNEWELMVFQLRDADGSIDEFSSGTLINPAGETLDLGPDDFEIKVNDFWRSPQDGVDYPGAWTIELPTQALTVKLRPLVKDQEMLLSTRYWEGAVSIEGGYSGQAVRGYGYAELTGYGQSMEGRF